MTDLLTSVRLLLLTLALPPVGVSRAVKRSKDQKPCGLRSQKDYQLVKSADLFFTAGV